MVAELIAVFAVALGAYIVKGATGFGSAITFVAVAGLFIGVAEAVVVATFLDLAGGLAMMRLTSAGDARGFWGPLVVSIAVGSVLGGLTLLWMPVDGLGVAIGSVVMLIGVWFLAGRPGVSGELQEAVPARPSWRGHAVSFLSGFSGGFLGMSGPPMVFYLGSWLAKDSFRRVLVPILLTAAVSRLVAYIAAGLVDPQKLLLVLVGLPPLIVGPVIGDKIFKKLPEVWFVRAVGLLLVAIAIKWLI